MKKLIALSLAVLVLCTAFTGCGAGFNTSSAIDVLTRESGSGTRSAFIELFGVETKDADGSKTDNTIATASVQSSTGVVLTTVAGDVNAIGYISLGAVDSTVKALAIDGAAPTADNVKNGSYKIKRNFNIVTKGDVSGLSDAAKDFIGYILSDNGQKVVANNDYISLTGTGAYNASKLTGKLVVAGSSSVTPLMEKLKEAYNVLNPDIDIEIQQSDSSSGIKSTADGVCDIGMASRDLKDSETSQGLIATVIGVDGLAVVINPANTVSGLTSDQVKAIYTGTAVKWSDVAGQ